MAHLPVVSRTEALLRHVLVVDRALNDYRNVTGPHTGKAKGRWPIHYSPDDITRAYFHDPKTRQWHTLTWEHAPSMDMPLSEDTLKFARQLCSRQVHLDDRLAVADLFARWDLGLGDTFAERSMALGFSRGCLARRVVDAG